MKYQEKYRELTRERSDAVYNPTLSKKGSNRRWYQHDIDTIIYSDMFRKMQRKAQLLSIHDPVSRSRLIHTFEVVRIAKEISEQLGLNSELTEAIALAHDFGNVAYGKKADEFLRDNTGKSFRHEEISVLMLKVSASRPVPRRYRDIAKEEIDKNPKEIHIIKISDFPYNLEVYQYNGKMYYVCISPEVLEGIAKHGTEITAGTLEAQVVNYADNIAYLIQDISDFEAVEIFDDIIKKEYAQSLRSLEQKDGNKKNPLSGIVGRTTSLRTATLIERFVTYNKQRLDSGVYETTYSEILEENIPILKSEDIVTEAINLCWEFKKKFYQHPLIELSNQYSQSRMEQIWNILDENSCFVKQNTCYRKFKELLSSPIFFTFKKEKDLENSTNWEEWDKACFIAHLTCDEIDLIIKSFLERDYVFDLSLPKIK